MHANGFAPWQVPPLSSTGQALMIGRRPTDRHAVLQSPGAGSERHRTREGGGIASSPYLGRLEMLGTADCTLQSAANDDSDSRRENVLVDFVQFSWLEQQDIHASKVAFR